MAFPRLDSSDEQRVVALEAWRASRAHAEINAAQAEEVLAINTRTQARVDAFPDDVSAELRLVLQTTLARERAERLTQLTSAMAHQPLAQGRVDALRRAIAGLPEEEL